MKTLKVKDLAPNPKNPQVTTDKKLAMLKKALLEFGDLSGIVFNRKTNQMVGGHKRTKQFDADSVITITKRYSKPTQTGTVAEGYVELGGERFSYREVSWDVHREMAANIAANKGAGEWDLPQLGEWMKELGSFDVDFDMDLTMFGDDELAELGVTTVREHTRMLAADGSEDEVDDDDSEDEFEEPEKLIGEVQLFHSGCLEVLKSIKKNSVDALVTDPPAGISFMGKSWDGDKGGRREWIAWMESVMRECMRVLKPGAHGLVWALPRTSHWTAMALEDAGFEVRDCVYHVFGSGFPKSLDVSKAIDKAAGAERNVVGRHTSGRKASPKQDIRCGALHAGEQQRTIDLSAITAPATDDAKQWQGFGTALKPAVECWWLVRKPLSEKTVAANVVKWGTGALNIDGVRIEFQSETDALSTIPFGEQRGPAGNGKTMGKMGRTQYSVPQGRFPSHLLFSCSPHCTKDQHDIECAIAELDRQSAGTRASKPSIGSTRGSTKGAMFDVAGDSVGKAIGYDSPDSGGASRFFYCAKVSSSERNAGCGDMSKKQAKGGGGIGNYAKDVNSASGKYGSEKAPAQNSHPTVKPQKLMRYLCRLVTPPGGVVLDLFSGSGSTGVAALREGFKFVGIEQDKEYFKICKQRLNYRANKTDIVTRIKVTAEKTAEPSMNRHAENNQAS